MTKMSDQAALATIGAATRELRLPVVRTEAPGLAEQATRERVGYLGYLADVLCAEADERNAHRRERRIAEARFPRLKRLSEFDLGASKSVGAETLALWRRSLSSTAASRSSSWATVARANPTC